MSIRCLISFASLFVLCVLVACAGTSKTSPRAWGDGARGAERAAPEIIDELLSSLSASAEACGRGQADGCTRILRHTVNGASAAARTAYIAAFEAGCEQGVPAACGGWGMANIRERGAPRRYLSRVNITPVIGPIRQIPGCKPLGPSPAKVWGVCATSVGIGV